MKKSTLLSFLTAASVVVTTAGTYSQWDNTTAETTAQTVTFRNPVTVGLNQDLTLSSTGDNKLGETPIVSGSTTFNISNEGNLANKLTITPVVDITDSVNGQDKKITASDLNITIQENGVEGKSSEGLTPLVSDVDQNPTSSKTYNVIVSPKDVEKTFTGTNITIKLQAELSKSE